MGSGSAERPALSISSVAAWRVSAEAMVVAIDRGSGTGSERFAWQVARRGGSGRRPQTTAPVVPRRRHAGAGTGARVRGERHDALSHATTEVAVSWRRPCLGRGEGAL